MPRAARKDTTKQPDEPVVLRDTSGEKKKKKREEKFNLTSLRAKHAADFAPWDQYTETKCVHVSGHMHEVWIKLRKDKAEWLLAEVIPNKSAEEVAEIFACITEAAARKLLGAAMLLSQSSGKYDLFIDKNPNPERKHDTRALGICIMDISGGDAVRYATKDLPRQHNIKSKGFQINCAKNHSLCGRDILVLVNAYTEPRRIIKRILVDECDDIRKEYLPVLEAARVKFGVPVPVYEDDSCEEEDQSV